VAKGGGGGRNVGSTLPPGPGPEEGGVGAHHVIDPLDGGPHQRI
jgi:hypothetical protein